MHSLPEVEPPLKFPYSIVFCPIPVLSWLIPVIGHVGVCNSEGVIHDFAGPYYVNVGTLIFGTPTRYWQLDPAQAAALVTAMQTTELKALAKAWDAALQVTKHTYQQRTYNFLSDNCHSFAAHFLCQLQYASNSKYNMVLLAAEVLRFGKFVGLLGLMKTWGPFAVVMPLGVYLVGIYWLAGWLLSVATVAGWFIISTYFIKRDAPAVYRAVSV